MYECVSSTNIGFNLCPILCLPEQNLIRFEFAECRLMWNYKENS